MDKVILTPDEETSVADVIEADKEITEGIDDTSSSSSPFPDTYTYFSREGRIMQRKMVVNYLYSILKSDHEESNKMLSFSLKCIHFSFPIMLIPIVLISPVWVVYALLVSCILMKITFWYFNGCFLSNLEYKLNSENDVNVVDPLVFAAGKKISKESRVEVSVKATNLLITFLAAMIIWKENGSNRS